MTFFICLFLLLLFYCSFMVILSDHPINALLFLIGSFINVSLILILFGLDFIALVFVAIYVGAIAIFFLFVIMMMNIPSYYKKKWILDEYLLLGLLFVGFFLIMNFIYDNTFFLTITSILQLKNLTLLLDYTNTIETLGVLFYTHFFIKRSKKPRVTIT